MKSLHTVHHQTTLVDQVESNLIEYFKANNLTVGSTIPNEAELSGALGVARGVLREALSRLKMIGMIEARTRRGMIITEPSLLGPMRRTVNPAMLSDDTMFDLLGFRIALEIGMCDDLFNNVTPDNIKELDMIVRYGQVTAENAYTTVNEFAFHSKLYEIVGNRTITEFQGIIHCVMDFIKDKFETYFLKIAAELKTEMKLITHEDLLNYIKSGDKEGYKQALQQHFQIYRIFLSSRHTNRQPAKQRA